MEIKDIVRRTKGLFSKYKYAVIVLLVGVGLLLIPQKNESESIAENSYKGNRQTIETTELAEILQSIQGAGNVKVLLSVASGEKTIYQTDEDISIDGDSSNTRQETVIVTDAQRVESGLIKQIDPPIYLGAIVVCEGADSASVRLAITQAVAKITGLGTDDICVLKMKS